LPYINEEVRMDGENDDRKSVEYHVIEQEEKDKQLITTLIVIRVS
jgi:hypothetical protein